MTNRIDDILLEIESALGLLDLRVYRDAGNATVDPPGVVMGPPSFTWDGYNRGPTEATLSLYLVVKYDDRVMLRLNELIEDIADTVDEHVPDASVTHATPATYPISATVSLPAYQFTVELNLE